jgi:hypothetical protein
MMEDNCSSPTTTKSNKEAKSPKQRTLISSPSAISLKRISNILSCHQLENTLVSRSEPCTVVSLHLKSPKRRTLISSPSAISPKCISNILLSPAGKIILSWFQGANHVQMYGRLSTPASKTMMHTAFDHLMYLTTQKSNQFKNSKR